MQTLRLAFDPQDSPRETAQRAAAVASDGDYLLVQGSAFIVREGRALPVLKAPDVYQVLPLDAAPKVEAPKPKVETPRPVSNVVAPGMRLVPRDARRRHLAVEVAEVLDGSIRTTKGRYIKTHRLNRYDVVSS
jgi:hypothetical protein